MLIDGSNRLTKLKYVTKTNHCRFKIVTFADVIVKTTAMEAVKQIPRKRRTLAKVVYIAFIAKSIKYKKVKLTKL